MPAYPPPDKAALATLSRKLSLLIDRVTAVATGHETGLYLWGSGGIGKSHTVLARLEELETSHKLFNSRMTAKGLYSALDRAPDAVHVLEDMERLTNDRDAQGVLRSALWAQPGRERIVTWTTATGGEERFAFRGGIIMIANRPLAALPELRALATRIASLRLEVTDSEAVAKMRELAIAGHRIDGKLALESRECGKVTEYLIRECRAVGCPLDLRLQVKGYLDYLLWEKDQTRCTWEDLITSRVREAANQFRGELTELSQEERRAQRRKVAKEVIRQTQDTAERERLYEERTGKSRADFYRRKREVESGEFEEAET
jgi:hypothetical protein